MSQSIHGIDRKVAEEKRAPFDLDSITWAAVRSLILGSDSFDRFAPEGKYAVDPRDGGITLFNQRRAKRPQDYTPSETTSGSPHARAGGRTCPICAGKTTPIIDIAELDGGFTFINTNLYPIIAPAPAPASNPVSSTSERHALGAHFLQWTSSDHDTDWPELSVQDRSTVMGRLAALEKELLEMTDFPAGPEGRFVSIIKNVGRSVGGSLSHGHQQIALSNVMPRRVRENLQHLQSRGEPFSRTLSESTPKNLTIAELEHGKLVVPYYMRRPYDMLFLLDNDEPAFLHELSREELSGLAEGFALGMRLMRTVLLSLDREIAYNVLVHTGPGAGIYLEFLPWTQENGGYEQLGLSACQGDPEEAVRVLRNAM